MITYYEKGEKGFPFGTIVYTPDVWDLEGPVLISMHGKGESGDGSKKSLLAYEAKTSHLPYLLKNGIPIGGEKLFPDFPVVMPLLPYNYTMEGKALLNYRNFIAGFFNTGSVGLMGLSFSGQATWKARRDYPNDFSVFIPIAGNFEQKEPFKPSEAGLWAHHGAKDTVVYPDWTIKNFGQVAGNRDAFIKYFTTLTGFAMNEIAKIPFDINIEYLDNKWESNWPSTEPASLSCSIYANEGHPAHYKTYTRKEVWDFIRYHLFKGVEQTPVEEPENPFEKMSNEELLLLITTDRIHHESPDWNLMWGELEIRGNEVKNKYNL